MEPFKILFWIATFYGCLQAGPIPLLKSSLKVDLMKKHVTCESDSTFYTPENVEEKCLTAALRCVQMELSTVKKECQDPYEYVDQGINALEELIKKRSDNQTCSCESWPPANFTNFLNSINYLYDLNSSLNSHLTEVAALVH